MLLFTDLLYLMNSLLFLEHCMKIFWHVTSSWLLGNVLVVSVPVAINEKERDTTLLMCS